jgi:hypothetical protein
LDGQPRKLRFLRKALLRPTPNKRKRWRYYRQRNNLPKDTPMGESKRRRATREFLNQRPEQRLGDAPVDQIYHDTMTAVMKAVDEAFNGNRKGPNKEIGVVLMVFPFGNTEGRCNYMSNGADRRDIVTLMKEMIARFEGQAEASGRA